MKQLNILQLILTVLIVQSCAIQPAKWQPPVKPEKSGVLTPNNALSTTEWIGIGEYFGPEDIAIDGEGNIYTGVHHKDTFDNGRVLKITPEGVITTFCDTKSWITGLHFDSEQNLIACDTQRGLVKIDTDGKLTVLTNKTEKGECIMLPNDVDIATDGMIYFSNTSTHLNFSAKHARKIILETKPDGGLYRYNPFTKETTTLIDSSFFGNGVAVAKDDAFVLMVDLTKYRILRYWLKGEKTGITDLFMNNLPGLPNGISRRKDGTFWLGFTTQRSDILDKLHPHPKMKQFTYAMPMWLQPKQEQYGLVLHINEKGEILHSFHDPTGKFVSEASSIEERDGYLYLGGDLINHIGKFKLPVNF